MEVIVTNVRRIEKWVLIKDIVDLRCLFVLIKRTYTPNEQNENENENNQEGQENQKYK
jgi:hypothetical protein